MWYYRSCLLQFQLLLLTFYSLLLVCSAAVFAISTVHSFSFYSDNDIKNISFPPSFAGSLVYNVEVFFTIMSGSRSKTKPASAASTLCKRILKIFERQKTHILYGGRYQIKPTAWKEIGKKCFFFMKTGCSFTRMCVFFQLSLHHLHAHYSCLYCMSFCVFFLY